MSRSTHIKDIFTRCLLLLACIVLGSTTLSYAQSEIVLTEEADQATIDGGSIQQIEGFTYYEVQSSGYVEWPFEIATAGTYDLVLNTRLPSGTKEQHISINGERFKNQAFPGNDAFVFDEEVLGTEWVDYRISADTIYAPSDMSVAGPEILTLEAGSHTLRIEPSEGFQQFSGFSLVDAASGDTAVTVVAPDAVAEEVTPMCEESDFCPTGFRSVALREGAFLTFDILFPENASYQLHIFYNAPNGGFSDLLLDWNIVVDDMDFASTEGDLLTTSFEAETGRRSLTMDTERGGFNVDYVQLIKVSDSTSTSNEQPDIEDGFSVAQNYPNPFSGTTTIAYTLGSPSPVKLTVYDVLGREVHELSNTNQPAGTYLVTWDGRDAQDKAVAGGVYFYQMETNAGIETRQMILMPR